MDISKLDTVRSSSLLCGLPNFNTFWWEEPTVTTHAEKAGQQVEQERLMR